MKRELTPSEIKFNISLTECKSDENTKGKEREKLMIKSQKLLKHLKTHSDRLKMDIEKQWIL